MVCISTYEFLRWGCLYSIVTQQSGSHQLYVENTAKSMLNLHIKKKELAVETKPLCRFIILIGLNQFPQWFSS